MKSLTLFTGAFTMVLVSAIFLWSAGMAGGIVLLCLAFASMQEQR